MEDPPSASTKRKRGETEAPKQFFYYYGGLIYTEEHGCMPRVFCIDEAGVDHVFVFKHFKTWIDIKVPDRVVAKARGDEDVMLSYMSRLLKAITSKLYSKRRSFQEVSDDNVRNEKWFDHPSARKSLTLDLNCTQIEHMYPLIGYSDKTEPYARVFMANPMVLDEVQALLAKPLSHTRARTNPHTGEKSEQRVAGWMDETLALETFGLKGYRDDDYRSFYADYVIDSAFGKAVDYKLRFDHVMRIRPCCWFEVPRRAWAACERQEGGERFSSVQNEYVFDMAALRHNFVELPDKDIPMHRIKAFGYDIECLGSEKSIPKPELDPVISISICTYTLGDMVISKDKKKGLVIQGGEDRMKRYVLQLHSVSGGEIEDDTPAQLFANVDAPSPVRLETFEDEAALLNRFAAIFHETSPHVCITYNGNGFDTPYIMKRSKLVGAWDAIRRLTSRGCDSPAVRQVVSVARGECKNLENLTALTGGKALAPDELLYSERVVTTRAFGTQIRKNVYMPGVLNFDLLMWWRNQLMESDYRLGAVSQTHLGRTKKDLPYYLIPNRFQTPEGRREIAEYCVVDTVLTCYLAQLKSSVIMYMSMGNVQMVDVEKKFMSGQQYCLLSMLVRKALYPNLEGNRPRQTAFPEKRQEVEHVDDLPEDHALHDEEDNEGESGGDGPKGKREKQRAGDPDSYQGATVLDVKAGYYKDPIGTNDFAALYPSIMRNLNMSYDTYIENVPKGWSVGRKVKLEGYGEALGWELQPGPERLKKEYDCYEVSNGCKFVHPKHCKGFLSQIAEDLVNERNKVKKQLKEPGIDEGTRQVRDHKQLAIKYAANSTYGATGAKQGVLPYARFVADSVTTEGREMIDTTKTMAEAHGIRPDGTLVRLDAAQGAEGVSPVDVVYGDTDSVMMRFAGATGHQAKAACVYLAGITTAIFAAPVSLEFEKVSLRSIFKQRKKRYAFNMFEDGDDMDNPDGGKIKLRGMSAIRRDNNAFKRNLEMQSIKLLLDLHRTPDRAVEDCFAFIRAELKRLREGNVPINDLMINVSLTKPLEDYDLTRKSPKLCAAQLMLKNNKLVELGPGDRFYILIANVPHVGSKGVSVSDRAVDVASFIKGDMRVDIDHYVKDTENVVKGLMSIFFLDAPERRVSAQGVIGGGRLTVERALASNLCKRSFHLKNGDAHGEKGFKEAYEAFYSNVTTSQFALENSLWNPYRLTGDEKPEELRETIRECYRHLGAEWNGELDDPISIFSIADPSLYTKYYALCKLRALEDTRAAKRARGASVLSLLLAHANKKQKL